MAEPATIEVKTSNNQLNCSEFAIITFLFSGKNNFAIIPIALQKRRVEKILATAVSTNIFAFRKYGKTYPAISGKTGQGMATFEDAPEFKEKTEVDCMEKTFSASHLKFLQDCGIETGIQKRLSGKHEYELTHVILES